MGKRKLLIVDDEASISIIIEINFADNFEIVKTHNGKEALEWLHEGNMPDAIVADLNMPEMDGLQFIKEIRGSGLFKDLPLIVLSSDETSGKKIECLNAGADDYLVKPFNPLELEARINRILARLKY